MIDPVKVQAYIDKMSGGKSPLNASFFIRISEETQVPIQLILAQAAQESNFGTKGRAVRTKNMFNIGNYTEGDLYPAGHPKNTMNSKFMNSWEKGAYAYANIVKRDYLKDKDMNELLNSYVSDKGRYAEDLNYEKKLKWHLNKMGDLNGPNLYDTDKRKYVDSTLNANKNMNWVNRLYDPNRKSMKVPGQEGMATHYMESSDRKVYPTVVADKNGDLRYLGDSARTYADRTKTYIEFPTEERAAWFGENYKRGTNVLSDLKTPTPIAPMDAVRYQQRRRNQTGRLQENIVNDIKRPYKRKSK